MFPGADFVDDYGCEDNKIWVCGSFDDNEHGQSFRDSLQSHYGNDDGIALAIVPDDEFCAAFPGAVVSIKSYDYTSKYDHTWTYTSGWKPNTCKSCDIDFTYTCPLPPPPPEPTCNVCWEWTLSGCEDSYYSGDTCDQALHKLEDVLTDIGYGGEQGCYGCC